MGRVRPNYMCEQYHETKTGYFNTGFIFLRCKIQIDIQQNSDKKNKYILKKYIYITIITTKIKNKIKIQNTKKIQKKI